MNKQEKKILRKEKLKKELEDLKKQRNEDIKAGNTVYEAKEDTLKQNKKYHWPLFYGLKAQRSFSGYKLHVLNKLPKYYYTENNDKKKVFDRPVIFTPNHVRKKDIEMLLEAIKKHVILLSGDFENLHGTLSGSLLEKNGIIYLDMVNPYDNEYLKKDEEYLKKLEEYIKTTNDPILIKEYENEKKSYNTKIQNIINDRKNVKEVERQVLSAGKNIIKFYEASWNLSPNRILYVGYFSLVQTAVDTNALVIPVAYEQPVDFDMKDNDIYIKFGDPIDFCKYFNKKPKEKMVLTFDEKRLGLDIVRDRIGNLLLDILNKYSKVKRKDIPKDYWQNYKKHVLSEWYFNEEDIEKKHFVDKTIVEQEDAFEHLNNLDINKNNAFLLNKRNHH